MKKLMLFFMMVLFLVPVIAQVVEPPGDVVDVITNIETFMGSMAGIAVLSVFLTGLFNGWFNIQKTIYRQLLSWVVPILLIFVVTGALGIGFLVGQPWYTMLIYGLGVGLVSNGIFDITFVKTLVVWIERQLGNKF